MRKIIIVVLLLLLSISSIYASKGEIGILSSAELSLGTIRNNNSIRIASIDIMLDGATYFGRSGMFGLDYGAGITMSWEGQSYPEYNKFYYIGGGFKLGFGFSIDITSLIDITGGAGIKTRVSSCLNDFVILADIEEYIDAAVRFKLAEHFGLSTGIAIGYHSIICFDESSMSLSNGGLSLSPFVGVSFLY